jgi:hypothetical protein
VIVRVVAVSVLALSLAATAGARSQHSAGSFCGSTEGAQWLATRQYRPNFVGNIAASSYWVWRKGVSCGWAMQKTSFITHALGTSYMSLAHVEGFKCRMLPIKKRQNILSLKPRRAQGECVNTNGKSVKRFAWEPTLPK